MIATALWLRGGRRVTIAWEMSLNTTLLLKHGIGTKTSSAQSISYRQVFPSTAEARGSSDQDTQMHDIFKFCHQLVVWPFIYCFALVFVPPLIKTEGTTLSKLTLLCFSVWEIPGHSAAHYVWRCMNQRLLFFWKSYKQIIKNPTQRCSFFSFCWESS